MTGSPARPSDLGATLNRVLVTGGAGYIGSHACKALAQTGMLCRPPLTISPLDTPMP
jgi:NAD dependent epimerase/dehydratase family